MCRATSAGAAIELAEAEALEYAEYAEYAECLGDEDLGFAQSFLLADEPAHGGEVFSLCRDSELEPGAFVDRFFDTGNQRQGSLDRRQAQAK